MPTTHTTQIIIEEVGALMGRHRITQGELARAVGLSAQSMSQRMQAHINFRVDELEAIAAYFDVPITALFTTSNPGGDGPRRGMGGRTQSRCFAQDEQVSAPGELVTT
jgi:transcriptional regulator with XRE-family HTH domain